MDFPRQNGRTSGLDLTVVLTNYLRPKNVATILDALASQSLPHQLFVWDNSPGHTFQDSRADWIVHSSRNARCGARWWMAAHAETPWTVVMDDDLMPADSGVLLDLLASLSQGQTRDVVGAAGVILEASVPYAHCCHVGLECKRIETDTEVDIVKGRFFAAPTEKLRNLGYLPLDCEDDIAVSSVTKGGVILPWLQDRLRELPTGEESRWRRSQHADLREAARQRWLGN